MTKIAFLTYAGGPEITANDQLLADALSKRGAQVEACVWDDDAIDWSIYHVIVIRSTWDYHFKYQKWLTFLDHLESIKANLWNPVSTIRWNADKKYLIELSDNGILIPKTTWIQQNGETNLRQLLAENSWKQAVVKPNLSATAFNTWDLTQENADKVQSEFDRVITKKPMMVQEFMKEIQKEGEWSFVFINNEYSHSVLKKPAAGDFRVQANFGGSVKSAEPADHFIEEAEKVLYTMPMRHLYARVDAVISDGALFLMELELIEPQLFLSKENGSVERLAKGLLLK